MNTSAHVIFDFKQKNLVNFSNKMRLPYLTYFRCAFGCWILFSKAKNSQSIRRSCEFHFSFFFLSLFRSSILIEYEKKDISFFCILIDFLRLLLNMVKKYESECFTWNIKDTCLAAISCWLDLIVIFVSISLEFSWIWIEFKQFFFFSLAFSLEKRISAFFLASHSF